MDPGWGEGVSDPDQGPEIIGLLSKLDNLDNKTIR